MPEQPSPAIKKPLPLGRKLLFSLISLLFFGLIIVGVGEIFVRLTVGKKYKINDLPPPYNTAQKDGYLGWKMTPGYTFTGKMRDQFKQEYDISIRYDANGFKAFGDTASARPKVLFLGDSYTASIEASNKKTFYNLLADSLGIEVFAYGHAGFSTLQEYMVLDTWVDRIRPDVVVWETCSNDFIDNYAPLEIVCGYKVGQRRPYLATDGSIFYRRPLSGWQWLREHVFFFRWLEERWEGVEEKVFKKEKRVGEYYIATDKRNFRPFDESVKVTGQIMAMAQKRLPAGTKLVGFSADIYEPQMSEFKRIFEANGFPFYEEPARLLERTGLEQKIAVKAVDECHWNETGQALIAAGLLPFLKPLVNQ
ncbi:MAG: SGNH/GDSL hydrolase family protein [Bacteroidetes bacterium]|nr:SGNH/GDSL hydrolase family protein [Bacteroidota bacterium]